jgi:hypothetical protein
LGSGEEHGNMREIMADLDSFLFVHTSQIPPLLRINLYVCSIFDLLPGTGEVIVAE